LPVRAQPAAARHSYRGLAAGVALLVAGAALAAIGAATARSGGCATLGLMAMGGYRILGGMLHG
jgi:hypothetical protein